MPLMAMGTAKKMFFVDLLCVSLAPNLIAIKQSINAVAFFVF
jgi:hypothetical protein